MTIRVLVCTMALLAFSPAARAVLVDPTKANGDFLNGTGIPGNNFTSATSGGGDSVFLKVRGRDTGQALSQTGNVYTVATGLAADNVNPYWAFDWQFTPAVMSATSALRLDIDFDPATGAASFKTVSLPIFDADTNANNSWDDGDGYLVNPGGGAWSNNTTPYVVANSWHMGFAFWPFVGPSTLTYNSSLPGEYQINLTALDGSNMALASTTVFANVVAVPEASQVALMAVASVFGLGLYLKRK